jgi:hypothetical protein
VMQALVGGSPQLAAAIAGGTLASDPRMQSALAGMNEAVAHPLSHEESMKVLGDLGVLGLLDEKSLGEARGCLAAGGADRERALGTMAAFFKANVLPQLMDARARFASLTPTEQTELAAQVTEELQRTPAHEREEFLSGVGAGLFPESVLQQVRASLK